MKVSIKRAVIIPFMLVVIVIMLVIGVVWRQDYQWMVDTQGSRILRALNENTLERLNSFVKNPLHASKIYSSTIEREKLYIGQDLTSVERYSLEYMKQIVEDMPQVSTIGFGNEHGDYIGIRYDDKTKTVNLMLKDARTKGLLNIYEGTTIQSKVVASYENYDPRVRPWYAPVKVDQRLQWSDFYMNFDEKKEATISILAPVFDENKVFQGVVVTDVKLDGINQFLRNEHNRGGGAVYITDLKGQVVGHSVDEPVVVELKKGPPPEGRLLMATESSDVLIKNSAQYLMSLPASTEGRFDVPLKEERSFGWVTRFHNPSGLNWNVVAVLSEKDLMGDVLAHQGYSMLVVLTVALLGLLVGMFMLNRLTQPIIRTSQAIAKLAGGNWESGLELEHFGISETSELIQAFNSMAEKLKSYIAYLRDSEEKYKMLVENSEDMIYSLDPKGRFVSVNSAFEKVTGISRDEIIGKEISYLVKDEDEFHKWHSDMSKALNKNEAVRGVTHVVNPEGKQIMFNMTLIPVTDEQGKVIGVTGTNHNITDLMELESEKISSLSYVVTGIAHEINTPVGNCITVISYMLAELDEVEEQMREGTMKRSDMNKFIDSFKESGKHIIRNLEKSKQLVEAFKELASNRSMVNRVEINLANFIQTVYESIRWSYPEKNVEWHLICPPNLVILCEQVKVAQVFSELIENSYIHGFEDRDTGKIEIEITGPDQKNYLYITYRDNGKGISKEISKDIFTPFFSTKFGTSHNGLGLNVVYNIIRGTCNGELMVNENYSDGFEIRMVIKKQ